MLQTEQPDWEGIERNRVRPKDRLAILQTWHDLIFLHAMVPSDLLQKMVPSELRVEEFDGSGWLGFVPFRMSNIRKPNSPTVPWLSSFYETNIRTYVSHPKYGPGVWFFSLDAARYLACWYARQFFKLPYFHAEQTGHIDKDCWQYSGHRRVRQALPAVGNQSATLTDYKVSVRPTGTWHEARPLSFEYWLVERYRLYSLGSRGDLMTARVFHEPYLIQEGQIDQIDINGLESQFGNLDFQSVLLAKTLNVQCFSPHRV